MASQEDKSHVDDVQKKGINCLAHHHLHPFCPKFYTKGNSNLMLCGIVQKNVAMQTNPQLFKLLSHGSTLHVLDLFFLIHVLFYYE
jgi:hypothetical protein